MRKLATSEHHALESKMRKDYISTLPEHPVYPRELLLERQRIFEKQFKKYLKDNNLEI